MEFHKALGLSSFSLAMLLSVEDSKPGNLFADRKTLIWLCFVFL